MNTILLVGSPTLGKYSLTDIFLNQKIVDLDNPIETIDIRIIEKDKRIIECAGLTEYITDFDKVYDKAEDAVHWRTKNTDEKYKNFDPKLLPSKDDKSDQKRKDANSSWDNENKGFHALIFIIQYGTRFTKQDVAARNIIKELFGEHIFKDLGIILFAAIGETVSNESFQEYIKNGKGDLEMFLNEVEHRFCFFNIHTGEEVKKEMFDEDENKDKDEKEVQIPMLTEDTFDENSQKLVTFLNNIYENKPRFTIHTFLHIASEVFNKRLEKKIDLFGKQFDSFKFHISQLLSNRVVSYDKKVSEQMETTFEQIRNKENFHKNKLQTLFKQIENSVKTMKDEIDKTESDEKEEILQVLHFLAIECKTFDEPKSCLRK